MQKSLFQGIEPTSFADEVARDENYLIKIEIEAQRMRAEAFAQLATDIRTGFAKTFGFVTSWVRKKMDQSRILNELYAMDDRTLADIGLTRDQINSIVYGNREREPVQPVPANLAFLKPQAELPLVPAKTTKDDSQIAA